MRSLSVLCVILLSSSLCFSQIPNSGFENWANDGSGNINPVGWQTSNSSPYVNVDSVRPAHSGTYAMRVKTLDLGFAKLPGAAILQARYAFTQTPTRFGAWVKSTIMSGDTAFLIVGLMKGDTVVAATDSCTFKIATSYSQYTYLEFPIRVVSNKIPDSLYIMVATGLKQNPPAGTEIIVDDLVFATGVTNVDYNRNVPGAFSLAQNFPNPFNPQTEIRYEMSVISRVRLAVYDLLGREVALLVDEALPAGNHTATWNASGASSGVYLIRMTAGSFRATRKVVLAK